MKNDRCIVKSKSLVNPYFMPTRVALETTVIDGMAMRLQAHPCLTLYPANALGPPHLLPHVLKIPSLRYYERNTLPKTGESHTYDNDYHRDFQPCFDKTDVKTTFIKNLVTDGQKHSTQTQRPTR